MFENSYNSMHKSEALRSVQSIRTPTFCQADQGCYFWVPIWTLSLCPGAVPKLSLAGNATISIIFVATKVVSRQTWVCHYKTRLSSRQKYVCLDKTFVATKILVAAPANDNSRGSWTSLSGNGVIGKQTTWAWLHTRILNWKACRKCVVPSGTRMHSTLPKWVRWFCQRNMSRHSISSKYYMVVRWTFLRKEAGFRE